MVLSNRNKPTVNLVEQMPVLTVGDDPHIALTEAAAARLHVASKLRCRIGQ